MTIQRNEWKYAFNRKETFAETFNPGPYSYQI